MKFIFGVSRLDTKIRQKSLLEFFTLGLQKKIILPVTTKNANYFVIVLITDCSDVFFGSILLFCMY